MAYSKILAALNVSDEELDRQQRLAQRQERENVKQQERTDREAGWNAGGPIDNAMPWEYRMGQAARQETILDVDPDAPIGEGKLHIVEEEKRPWWKRL